jgi:DHA2 family multidrug resistance protein-like MFS transporter
LGEITAGLALGVLLFRQQAGREAGLLPVDLFRIPLFALSAVTSVCSYAAQTMALIALPFFIQDVLGRGQVAAGLLISPWPLAVAFVARIAGKLADRHSAGLLAGVGLAVMAAGLALLAALPADASAGNMLWRVVLCGFGFGFFQTPNNRAMMTAGPLHRSGAANGAMAGSRLLGQTSGAAIVAVIFALSRSHATVSAFLVAAGFAVLGTVISFTRLSQAAETRTAAP